MSLSLFSPADDAMLFSSAMLLIHLEDDGPNLMHPCGLTPGNWGMTGSILSIVLFFLKAFSFALGTLRRLAKCITS